MTTSIPSPRPVRESIIYILCATVASTLVASHMLLGWFTGELAGLIIPVAQLTPFAVSFIFFLFWRPASFTNVCAFRWNGTWWGLLVGFSAVIAISAVQLLVGPSSVGNRARWKQSCLRSSRWSPFGCSSRRLRSGRGGWRGWLVSRTHELPVARGVRDFCRGVDRLTTSSIAFNPAGCPDGGLRRVSGVDLLLGSGPGGASARDRLGVAGRFCPRWTNSLRVLILQSAPESGVVN